MRRREASINDVPVREQDRSCFWPAPAGGPPWHPGSLMTLNMATVPGPDAPGPDTTEAIFDLTWMEIAQGLESRNSECDAVVCLIGVAFGGEPADRPAKQPRRSYTQLEYFLARKLDKPVYRLLADANTPFDTDSLEPEVADLRKIQDEYRAEVIRNRFWRPFANVDQLRAELAELRFPWEGPPPDHKPNNVPLASIGTLFKGREAFLDDLHERLGASNGGNTASAGRLVVHGLGGVGKTRAAFEYAWRYSDEYTACGGRQSPGRRRGAGRACRAADESIGLVPSGPRAVRGR